jgi:GDP-L-fucose synthase
MSSAAANFFLQKRVFVTGGQGFLGSHLVLELVRRGAFVYAPPIERVNLLHPSALREALCSSRFDLVFHLAANFGGIGRNARDPARILRDNALMGIHLMDECVALAIPKLIAVGSVCAYPEVCPLPFREEDLWNGAPEPTNGPYGVAKRLLSSLSTAYRTQYKLNSVVVYPANLYGPRDHFDLETCHVIPAMIRRFSEAVRRNDGSVTLWGDGSPTREFLYAADCVEGLLLGAEHYDSSDPVNLGTGSEISIRDLARKIAALTGYAGAIEWDPSRPNGQLRRRIDTTRARERFGFSARTPLDEGLRTTVDWYQTVGAEIT